LHYIRQSKYLWTYPNESISANLHIVNITVPFELARAVKIIKELLEKI